MAELDALRRELSEQVLVVAMNVQDNHQIPAELEISSLPALALYQAGTFQRFIGGIGKKDAIRAQLPLP
jgi:thioredoxin-like negative regulator of GroEL